MFINKQNDKLKIKNGKICSEIYFKSINRGRKLN